MPAALAALLLLFLQGEAAPPARSAEGDGPAEQKSPVPGVKATPQEAVERTVSSVLSIIRDPAFAGEHNLVRRHAEIRRYAEELFDFPEMARRTLGPHWTDRSPRERDEFVVLFERVLERSYVTTIENYAGEPIVYEGQRSDGQYAVVNSKIAITRRAEIPIDYRLHETSAGWAVYDVIIEGVSLVSNYRTQFDRIIRKTSFQDLVDRMRRADITIMTIRPGAGKQ